MNSNKEENVTLSALNDDVAKENIGGAVFVGILMLVGFIGNSHSVYIYFFRYKSSSYRTFVLFLAFIDVLACCITMPFVLYMQRYPLMLQNGIECKIMKMLTYFITLGSAVILLIIAAERYRKVCVPHGTQILERKAKISCVIGCIVSFALSSPTLVLYGSKSVETGKANITGFECDVSDEYWDTPYPAILKLGLLLVFIVSTVVLLVIYILIWQQIVRSGYFLDSATPSSLTVTKNDQHHASAKAVNSPTRNGLKNANTVTCVLFLITIVFCISFLPHLILRICVFLNKSFVSDMSFIGRVMYNIFRWSFFINHMANPIIYGLCDQRYKSELQRMYKNILYCFCPRKKSYISID